MLRTFMFIILFFNVSQSFAQAEHSVIFGDSLSDEGRLYQATQQQFPPSPFFEGRFSDGPVWTEHLAGTRENFAFSGAKSDRGNFLENKLGAVVENTGLQAQIEAYLAVHSGAESMPKTDFYINIGANDFLAMINEGQDNAEDVINETVDNILAAAIQLREAGAEHILLIGLPDLSKTPFAANLPAGEQRGIKLISKAFNALLKNKGKHTGFEFFDLDRMVSYIMLNAQDHGLVNVTQACFDEVQMIVCSNPEQYFYWDDKHPTAVIHKAFAEYLR